MRRTWCIRHLQVRGKLWLLKFWCGKNVSNLVFRRIYVRCDFQVLKRILGSPKKALFVLPFVSVAKEKLFTLQVYLFQRRGVISRRDEYLTTYTAHIS